MHWFNSLSPTVSPKHPEMTAEASQEEEEDFPAPPKKKKKVIAEWDNIFIYLFILFMGDYGILFYF